jgi:hypothetical protein
MRIRGLSSARRNVFEFTVPHEPHKAKVIVYMRRPKVSGCTAGQQSERMLAVRYRHRNTSCKRISTVLFRDNLRCPFSQKIGPVMNFPSLRSIFQNASVCPLA